MEWYAAESTAEEKPKELDITSSPHLVYKRRNIERVPMSNENEESKAGEKWVYEECTQDKEEYEMPAGRIIKPNYRGNHAGNFCIADAADRNADHT